MKIFLNLNLIFFFIFSCISIGCKKNQEVVPVPSTNSVPVKDTSFLSSYKLLDQLPNNVYVAGSYNDPNTNSIASYWIGNQLVKLTDGSQPASATNIKIHNNDVYVCGYEGKVAKYWKNGISYALTDGKREAIVNDIFIDGVNVYTVAMVQNVDNTHSIACFKNTQPLDFTSVVQNLNATTIVVKEGDVYVAGSEEYYATVWKNGIPTHLTDGAYLSSINSMVLNGNDIYFAGFVGDQKNLSVPQYWKNFNPVPLPLNQGMALGMAVTGDDVYVAGLQGENLTQMTQYWKNGVAFKSSLLKESKDIAITGSDVHLLGLDRNNRCIYCRNENYFIIPDFQVSKFFVKK